MWRHYLYGTKCTIFTDHKSLQHIFDRKELNMRQMRWVELLNDYDCDIKYHLGKANVVLDAVSIKERVKPLRVRATAVTIQTGLKSQIAAAQTEVLKDENLPNKLLRNMQDMLVKESDHTYYFMSRLWIPVYGGLRKVIMDEAHRIQYSIHPGADKMYQDLLDYYWWPGMRD
jgi:hypothetical protein